MVLPRCLFAVCLFFCLQSALCSYLDAPRIHFAGKFHVDTGNINNEKCNYLPDYDIKYYHPAVAHDYGSNAFKFYGTTVTATASTSDGSVDTDNPLVGLDIVTNVKEAFAKLVDLDVDCQQHSTPYGMKLGVADATGKLLFYGKWTPCVITLGMWPQLRCFNDIDNCKMSEFEGVATFSSQSTTVLTEVEWADDADLTTYPILQTLKDAGDLAVRITLHSLSYNGNKAELGWIEGAIGIPSPYDSICIPGQRMMQAIPDAQPAGLGFNICARCSGDPWLTSSPVKVTYESKNTARVFVDFSMTVVMDNDRNVRNLGKLELALFDAETKALKFVIGEFSDYFNADVYTEQSGIYAFTVTGETQVESLRSNPLGVVQSPPDSSDQGECLAKDEACSASTDGADQVVLLLEHEYLIRHKDYYVGRLDAHSNKVSDTQYAYITSYGHIPTGITPTVNTYINPANPNSLPQGGVTSECTNYNPSTGVATFEFIKAKTIPELRDYGQDVCGRKGSEIPIDGQVYFFWYGIDGVEDPTFREHTGTTVYKAYSDVTYTRPYTWVKDVGPIMTQFARVTPLMRNILDMSDYQAVIQPHQLNLVKKSLMLHFDDPGLMPATRDLSPVKKDLILEWLGHPLYDHHCQLPSVIYDNPEVASRFTTFRRASADLPVIPEGRCDITQAFSYNQEIHITDSHFLTAFHVSPDNKCYHIKESVAKSKGDFVTLSIEKVDERPLLAHAVKSQLKKKSGEDVELACSKQSVVKQLQTALRLEWATLPTYLTTLYSIPHGCNVEIYHLIRLIVMQEMFHFALVGNMLISLGERPEIDSPNFTPSYPGPLPGCVLPGLEVSLKKLTREHIHDVLMMIELPAHTEVIDDMEHTSLFTIGAFYEEIKSCIEDLPADIFDESTAEYQVKWSHWDPNSVVGTLDPIKTKDDAIAAIETIVSQGEGAGLLNPKDIADKTYAHFFKFEEIYCGRHIQEISEDTYAYTGQEINLDPMGVSPMRDSPTTKDLTEDTYCYTQSRVFHKAYRNFLRKLQEIFNGADGGKPDDILVAIEQMEGLQLNAKRLMAIDFDGTQTCGPVWDYEFGQ